MLLGISNSICAESITIDGNYWKCITHDETNNQWTSQSIYQKVALNYAYAKCKRNSQIPATCRTSNTSCMRFIQGVDITPMWQCTALDRDALPWKSNLYPNREDAALAAQAYCKQKSSLPSTCFINLVTCLNKNEV